VFYKCGILLIVLVFIVNKTVQYCIVNLYINITKFIVVYKGQYKSTWPND